MVREGQGPFDRWGRARFEKFAGGGYAGGKPDRPLATGLQGAIVLSVGAAATSFGRNRARAINGMVCNTKLNDASTQGR